jgi:hypothetical protein
MAQQKNGGAGGHERSERTGERRVQYPVVQSVTMTREMAARIKVAAEAAGQPTAASFLRMIIRDYLDSCL